MIKIFLNIFTKFFEGKYFLDLNIFQHKFLPSFFSVKSPAWDVWICHMDKCCLVKFHSEKCTLFFIWLHKSIYNIPQLIGDSCWSCCCCCCCFNREKTKSTFNLEILTEVWLFFLETAVSEKNRLLSKYLIFYSFSTLRPYISKN